MVMIPEVMIGNPPVSMAAPFPATPPSHATPSIPTPMPRVPGTSVLSVMPHDHVHLPTRLLRPSDMDAVRLEPGEFVDAAWLESRRVPYTSQARYLLDRAARAPRQAMGTCHEDHRIPGWVHEAASCHRGLLDALGLDLPADSVPHGPYGPALIQYLVPAISLGWYLVTTLHATEHCVVLLEGAYGKHEAIESPFPVRWCT